MKIKKKYSNREPWLTDVLTDSIKKNDKPYVELRNKPTFYNITAYKQYRNQLTKLVTLAEKERFQDLLNLPRNNL